MSPTTSLGPGLGRPPDAVLIDAYVAGQPGGTGATSTNDVLDCIPPLPRLILAGGLTPENVADRSRPGPALDGRRRQRRRIRAGPKGSR